MTDEISFPVSSLRRHSAAVALATRRRHSGFGASATAPLSPAHCLPRLSEQRVDPAIGALLNFSQKTSAADLTGACQVTNGSTK
jgi:hypothetical protein